MYNGIGLQTPRGSGTNGYIQTNKFFVKPKTGKVAHDTKGFEGEQGTGGITRKPNKDILEHDRKRQIQLKLVVLEDKLLEQGFTDAEIEEKIKEARATLEAASASEASGGPPAFLLLSSQAKVSDTQSHQIAARKEKQMETFRAALGIKMSNPNEENGEGVDDGPSKKNVPTGKREHAFLDRDYTRKKQDADEDQKKGGKPAKDKKKEKGEEDSDELRQVRKKRNQDNSSETDSIEKNTRRNRNARRKGRRERDYETDSDSDNTKKSRSRKHKKGRRHDRDSDDDDSGDDNRKKKSLERKKKSRRYDSDTDSDSDGSTSDDDYGKKASYKRVAEKSKKSHRRHDSDDDSSSDSELPPQKNEGKKQLRTRARHDSDPDSEADSEAERKLSLQKSRKNQQNMGHKNDMEDAENELIQKGKNRRKNLDDSDSDSEKVRRFTTKSRDKSSKRGDTDADDFDDTSDNPSDENREKRERHDSDDEDSDGKDLERQGGRKVDSQRMSRFQEETISDAVHADERYQPVRKELALDRDCRSDDKSKDAKRDTYPKLDRSSRYGEDGLRHEVARKETRPNDSDNLKHGRGKRRDDEDLDGKRYRRDGIDDTYRSMIGRMISCVGVENMGVMRKKKDTVVEVMRGIDSSITRGLDMRTLGQVRGENMMIVRMIGPDIEIESSYCHGAQQFDIVAALSFSELERRFRKVIESE